MASIYKSHYLALTLLTLLMGSDASGQNPATEFTIHEDVQEQTDEIVDSLIAIRRDLYMHPELSGEEKRTSKKIEEYLLSLGLEVKTNIGGYGVVGILNGHKKGKNIAWRADIDALSSDFPDIVDYQSNNKGVRHICGHDVHTTIALGIANVLASQQQNLQGTIYFVFQPSEENLKGAKAMIDDGLFDIISPDEIYALHISPFPKGTIATKPEGMYAENNRITVSFKNSRNNKAVVEFTKKLISGLQNVKPDSKFWDMMNLGNPETGIASASTIYQDYILVNQEFQINKMNSTISISTLINTSDDKQQNIIVPFLRQRIDESEYSNEFLNIEYLPVTPTIHNDYELVNKSMKSISSVYGQDSVIPLTGVIPDGRSDDFALFQKEVPGVYFFLGGSNYETGEVSMPHSPDFAVDEDCIKTGVQFFSSMIIERLTRE